jgi:carbonic anhydrase/acetyltransferase-like protein (isoleucine patch superfamily)
MVVGEQTTPRVHKRPANVAELTRHLAALRERHPGAIFERYLDKMPTVASDALVCAGAAIIGDVTLGAGSSVWYNAVLRGDMNRIVVGAHSNIQAQPPLRPRPQPLFNNPTPPPPACPELIARCTPVLQDGTVVHLGDQNPTIIGNHVVVGHRAVLHGCTLEDHCLIGMQVCD